MWKKGEFKEIAKIIMGQSPKGSTYNEDGIGIALLNGPKEFTDRFPVALQWTTKPTKLCKKNDILFCVRGSSTGRINIADDVYCLGRGIAAIRAIDGKSNTNFIEQQLIYCLDGLLRLTAGSTFPNINRQSLEEFPVIIPNLSQQNEIAEILSTWDTAIEQTKRLKEAKMKRKHALMQRLLKGKKRFAEFQDQEWKRLKISDFTKRVSRVRTKPDKPFLAMGLRSHGKGTFQKPDFEPEKIAMTELYEVKENDLIVNITFAWEGAIAIVKKKDEGALVSHRFPTYEFKTEKVIPEFFKYLIIQKRFVYDLTVISPGGAGRNRVMRKDDFGEIYRKIPPIEEQKKIANVLNTADKEIELLDKQIKTLKKQKRGLMQKLLTGKVRVKVDMVTAKENLK